MPPLREAPPCAKESRVGCAHQPLHIEVMVGAAHPASAARVAASSSLRSRPVPSAGRDPMANEPRSPSAPAPAARPQGPEPQPTIEPASLEPIYTNFARVTGTPEELILDFGLSTAL